MMEYGRYWLENRGDLGRGGFSRALFGKLSAKASPPVANLERAPQNVVMLHKGETAVSPFTSNDFRLTIVTPQPSPEMSALQGNSRFANRYCNPPTK
jgi:hypothetical protein